MEDMEVLEDSENEEGMVKFEDIETRIAPKV